MRPFVERLALPTLGIALALALAGCGQKGTHAPEANAAADDASAMMLDNGTISDITATDATLGSGGGIAPANDAGEDGAAPGNASGNAADGG